MYNKSFPDIRGDIFFKTKKCLMILINFRVLVSKRVERVNVSTLEKIVDERTSLFKRESDILFLKLKNKSPRSKD